MSGCSERWTGRGGGRRGRRLRAPVEAASGRLQRLGAAGLASLVDPVPFLQELFATRRQGGPFRRWGRRLDPCPVGLFGAFAEIPFRIRHISSQGFRPDVRNMVTELDSGKYRPRWTMTAYKN